MDLKYIIDLHDLNMKVYMPCFFYVCCIIACLIQNRDFQSANSKSCPDIQNLDMGQQGVPLKP